MDLSQKVDVVKYNTNMDFETYFQSQTPLVIKGLPDNTIAGKIKKDEHTDLRLFLCNLFKYNPELRKEYPCPDVFKGLLDKKGYMFFGGKDTTVRIHYDIDMSNVLLTQFGGRKRVILIAPEYADLLYRLPFNTYSLIDFDNPDYTKFPALRYVKGYEVVLEPGDSIFMPSGYWHYMTYLEGSFSVSYRKLSPHLKDNLEGVVNLGVFLPLDSCMTAVFWPWFASAGRLTCQDSPVS